MHRIEHTTAPKYPDPIASSRFAAGISQSDPDGCAIAIIGIPDDTGVKLNNGRPGASEGPGAIRAALAKMGVADPEGWVWPRVFDAGDVEVVPGDLHATHERVTSVTRDVLGLGLFPVALGGGHDLTFPFVRAVAEKHGPMDGVYFDPHLDVREHDGSGMPFRKLIETGSARSLRIHGFDPMSNSREHVRWFQANGGRVDDISTPGDPFPDGDTFVSLDMDVFDSAFAPGVSALNAQGWSPDIAARWVAAAGTNPRVRCFDIMECSPPHDAQERTARLAARMLLTFLKAFSERAS